MKANAESYKLIRYLLVSLSLVSMFFAVVFAFYFSVLAYPFLICGFILLFCEIVFVWKNHRYSDKSKLIASKLIHEEILKEATDISNSTNQVKNSGTYLIYSNKENIISRINYLLKKIEAYSNKKMLVEAFVNRTKGVLNECNGVIQAYNHNFVSQRKKDYGYLWNKGNILLDDEQQTAIVTDEKYNLVVAAAGSGKTEVLITRIAYLTVRKPDSVNPNRVLAIAYQNKDVKQIERRLNQYGIIGVNVKTFHTLGLDVLQEANIINKILGRTERPGIIKTIFENELSVNSEFYQKFLNYIKSIHENDLNNEPTEEISSIRTRSTFPYTAINNEPVKSHAEKQIFDFLLTNKLNNRPIKVEYEHEIENVGKPDFYLPEYDLYIEHWGLTKNGTVPIWFDQTTKDYQRNKEKKKQWFEENGKLLVETFSHEYDDDHPETFLRLLTERIKTKLQEKTKSKFSFELMTYKELVEVVHNSDNDWISGNRTKEDLGNFIKNAKTYNLTPERILQKLKERDWSRKQQTFAKLAVDVYLKYEEKLKELHKIDFEDMINKAIYELTNDGELCKNKYEHILVDEYQDITHQTDKLVNALLKNNSDCKFFCVGDDWQSVMGFAGSNLEFFVNFEKHYSNPAITKISTNYRSVRKIVDAGTCLMKNNESCQRQKVVVSKSEEGKSIKILLSPHHIEYQRKYHDQIAHDCINRVEEYLKKGYACKDILILSRFMMINSNGRPRYHYIIENLLAESKERNIYLTNEAKDERGVRVLTVHKAKGLEAKVVFILNVIKDVYGFPSEIEDSTILEPARENYPLQSQREEERRLFYVALSRAKEDLNIYTWEPAISEFIDEIKDYTVNEYLSY